RCGYKHATQAPAARLMQFGEAACDRRADRNVADGRHYCLAGQEPVGTYRALHERKEPRTEVVRSFGVISSLTRFVPPRCVRTRSWCRSLVGCSARDSAVAVAGRVAHHVGGTGVETDVELVG